MLLTNIMLETASKAMLQTVCAVPVTAKPADFVMMYFLSLGSHGMLKATAAANRNILFINKVCIVMSVKGLPIKPTKDLKKFPKDGRSSKWKMPNPITIIKRLYK